VVIVGAGLGGCILAHALLESHDVTLVERGAPGAHGDFPLVDVGWPAGTEPHIGAGPGGSTQLWHNGLIEIDEEVFTAGWPFLKDELARYYGQAFQLLSGVPQERVTAAIDLLRRKYAELGLPGRQLPGLFYPRWPMNVWQALELDGKVALVKGDVTGFEFAAPAHIRALLLHSGGEQARLEGDVFVLAAGGLGSPVLLQKLAHQCPLPSLRHAGHHYEDHPMGFVGEVEVTVPVYKLWNFFVAGTGGNLRLPLVVKQNGLDVSFQLRPAAAYYREGKRERVGSVLNELRRAPWNLFTYLKLFSHWDDVLDILSFKFGVNLPTKHYTLLMTAQMPPAEALAIWAETDAATGRVRRLRRWVLTDGYKLDLRAAIDELLRQLQPVLKRARVFPDWPAALRTGAHHSGTARMSRSSDDGVCDADCRVHGLANLYVCDGSVIPASGIANTGLTIGALALRLGAHLKQGAL